MYNASRDSMRAQEPQLQQCVSTGKNINGRPLCRKFQMSLYISLSTWSAVARHCIISAFDGTLSHQLRAFWNIRSHGEAFNLDGPSLQD